MAKRKAKPNRITFRGAGRKARFALMARIKLAWDRMNIKHYDLGSHSSEGLKRLFNALQDRLVEADDDFKGLPSVADLEDAGLNTVKLQGDLYTPSKPWR